VKKRRRLASVEMTVLGDTTSFGGLECVVRWARPEKRRSSAALHVDLGAVRLWGCANETSGVCGASRNFWGV